MTAPGGKEGLATVDRVRSAMTERDRRAPTKTARQIGNRLVANAPARARSKGAIVLRPVFPEITQTPAEFNTESDPAPAQAA